MINAATAITPALASQSAAGVSGAGGDLFSLSLLAWPLEGVGFKRTVTT